MAEDNKRKKALVKLGEKNERYDSYGHKIEKPIERPAVVPPQKKPPEKPKEKEEPKTKQKNEENKAPRKKLYSSASVKENPKAGEEKIAPHERRILERAPKRKKNIFNIIKVLLILLLIAGTVCMFVFGTGEKDSDIEKAFLTTGTIENLYNVKAHIIHDEYGITAGFSGKMIAAVNDGDRVAAGATIGYIVKPEYESTLEQLRITDSKITAAQNAASYVESQHTELGAINEQIAVLTDKLALMSASFSNMTDYYSVIKDMELLFETKHEIMMNEESTDSYINNLKNERSLILNNLKNYMQEVKTSSAGVISFYADDMTSLATEKNNQISGYISKKGENGNYLSESALQHNASVLNYTVGTNVTQGQTVARISPAINYYIAIDVTDVDSSVFRQGKKITVRARNRDFSVEAVVEELLQYSDKTYVLLESSVGLAGSASSRIIDAELIIDYMDGLKVPKRALAEWDSAGLTARITILRANYISYVYVNILAEDGEYAIISPSNDFVAEDDEGITSVRVNDIFVVNYEKVNEGQIIGG